MLDVSFRSADARKTWIGCLELLDLGLGRVEMCDPAPNAIVVRDLERRA
jgi:hypothetical protein